MIAPVPPVAETIILPSEPLLQEGFVTEGVLKTTGEGCETVTEVVVVELPSVAVKVYVCAVSPLNVPDGLCVPTLGEILYVTAPEPPVVETTTLPSASPLQVGFDTEGGVKLSGVATIQDVSTAVLVSQPVALPAMVAGLVGTFK